MKHEMKAVILAGGEGTRLFPLTQKMPKPLVPVLNVPAMTHILRLLSAHGITKAAVTLKYRAQDIVSYYQTHDSAGVELHFFLEDTPLGTAGGIKSAEEFLDSDFLVISGDAICDFSLTDAIRFHEEKGAMATILMTERNVPLDFGGVVCSADGTVLRFVEKPSWTRVLSNMVNTGIYLLDHRILSEIPENTFCDFSRDVFPKLIGRGLYGYHADGYWCDIGSLDAYYACNIDALKGKIRTISPPKDERFIEASAQILPDAGIRGASVVGSVRICAGAVVESSIVMDGAMIGKGAVVRQSIICHDAVIGEHAVLKRGCIAGNGAVIESGAMLDSGTRIEAGKIILSEDIIVDHHIFSGAEGDVFRSFGFAGSGKTELVPSFLIRSGAAVVQVLGRRAVFFDDGEPSSDYVKNLIMSGALSAGADCTDGGSGFHALASFSVAHSGADFGIYVKSMGDDIYKVWVLDKYGFSAGMTRLKRIAGAMRKSYDASIPTVSAKEDDFYGDYLHYLVDNAKPLRVKLAVEEGACGEALYAAASLLGAACETGTKSMASDGYVFLHVEDDGELTISYRSADGGYVMIDRWHAAAALIKSKIAGGENVIYLPEDAPEAMAETVRTFGGLVKRYDAETEMDSETVAAASGQTWLTDPMLLTLLYVAELGTDKRILYAGEDFALAGKTIEVESAAAALRELAEHGADTGRGVVVLNFDGATVRVTAEDEHTVRLSAEAKTPRGAEDAVGYAEKGILQTVQNP